VIVPAFNEEAGIEATLQRLFACLREEVRVFEIIVVNDGSTDKTGQLLQRCTDIRLIEHPSQLGYGASLKSGIRSAKYDVIAITDADGTYPADRIAELAQQTLNADMVVGARPGGRQALLRRIPKWFLTRFAEWIARRPIADINSGLRAFRKPVVERFLNILPDGFSFTTTITLALLTNRYVVHYVPIDYAPRLGSSKIRPIRDTMQFAQLILRTGIYFAPLRVFLPVAGVFFLGFLVSLIRDLIQLDLTEATMLLLVAATQLGMFALLADMIDKRSG